MADNEVKIHIPSGWFSLLLSEFDRNKSMISKALAHDSDHDDHYCEILRRMEARDERVKAALIGNITSGDFVEINKNDYQDIIYILLENIDFYDNNGRLIYE